MRSMKDTRWLRVVLVFALLLMLVPRLVQAEGIEVAFTGVIIEHVNRRMADAVVDFVCIRHAGGEVWVVAGYLVPGREGLEYISNGPWTSSGEIDRYLQVEVSVQPYFHSDPYLLRVQSLFEFTQILFWRIEVMNIELRQGVE